MATLTGNTISSTYKDLLQVSNSNAGVDGTLRDVEDGEGTVSKLQISTAGVKSTGTLEATGDTTLGANLTLGGATVAGIKDEDTMSSDSATHLSTQQSIKAYVDGKAHLALGTTSSTALAGDTTTISSGQASAITANTAKTGITSGQASAITANTAKTGITSGQASAITANTAKTGITSGQASAITANTAKTGITSGQASAITANTAKTGITSGQASAITANTAKTTNATHTGEVTGSTALTVADDTIDEANLKADNSPTDDYVLTAKSSAAGGLSWTEVSGGGGGSGDITSVVAGTGLTGGATTGAATLNVDVGIADDKIAQIDSASVADDDFARFTANGLEGRSASEVLSDIGAAASGHAHGLNNLSDVNTTGEANGKIIKHNGSSWVIADDTDTNTNQLTTFTVSATTDTTPTTISQGDDLLFTAGTGITCETTADGTVTIANTVTNTDTKWDGGATGLTAGTGRTSLGLVIGTDVQAYDATIVVDGDIGTSVQAYDADTAKLDATQTWTKAQVPALQTAAFSALSSGVLDFDSYQNFVITLGASTNAFTNPTTDASNAGQTGVIVLIQDSSASTATWASDYSLVGGAAPTLSSGSAKVDVLPYMIQADNTILIGAPQLDFS